MFRHRGFRPVTPDSNTSRDSLVGDFNPELHTFYQLDAKANGHTPFTKCLKLAPDDGMRLNTVLIAEQNVIDNLGHKFTASVPVTNLSDKDKIKEALQKAGLFPTSDDCFFSDVDASIPMCYLLSDDYGAAPARRAGGYRPLDKAEQRKTLDGKVSQPYYEIIDLNSFDEFFDRKAQEKPFEKFVMKVLKGAGQRGIYLVKTLQELESDAFLIRGVQDSDGDSDRRCLVEEYIDHNTSDEFNVVGLVVNGRPVFRSVSRKIMALSSDGKFKEAGHIMFNVEFPMYERKYRDLLKDCEKSLLGQELKNTTSNTDCMQTKPELERIRNFAHIETNARIPGSSEGINVLTGRNQAYEALAVLFGESLPEPKSDGIPILGFITLLRDEYGLVSDSAKKNDNPDFTLRVIKHKVRPDHLIETDLAGEVLIIPKNPENPENEKIIEGAIREITKGRYQGSQSRWSAFFHEPSDQQTNTAGEQSQVHDTGITTGVQPSTPLKPPREDTPLLLGTLGEQSSQLAPSTWTRGLAGFVRILNSAQSLPANQGSRQFPVTQGRETTASAARPSTAGPPGVSNDQPLALTRRTTITDFTGLLSCCCRARPGKALRNLQSSGREAGRGAGSAGRLE